VNGVGEKWGGNGRSPRHKCPGLLPAAPGKGVHAGGPDTFPQYAPPLLTLFRKNAGGIRSRRGDWPNSVERNLFRLLDTVARKGDYQYGYGRVERRKRNKFRCYGCGCG